MLEANILTLAELAAATGRPEAWWRRHWLRMHDQHFFPRKLPGLWGWPRRAVEAWVAAGGGAAWIAAAPANQNGAAPDLAVAQALLEQRFGIAPH